MQPLSPGRLDRLPLHAELYLLAHDETDGSPRISEQSLIVGLAGAVLLELWLHGLVHIGWWFDERIRNWEPEPGRLVVAGDASAGNVSGSDASRGADGGVNVGGGSGGVGGPLAGDGLGLAAIIARRELRPTGPDHLKTWIRAFAAPDLLGRVRAGLTVGGVLRHSTRRRFGVLPTEAYLPLSESWQVRAGAEVRSLVLGLESGELADAAEVDDQCAALCGLVVVLELVPFLHLSRMTAVRASAWLNSVVAERDPAIGDVIAAVDAGRGDLVVSAMA